MDRASAEAIGQFIADHPGRMRTMAWPGLILARSPIVGDIIESVLNIRRRKPEGGKEGVGKSVCLHYHSRRGGNEVRGLGGKGDDTAAVTAGVTVGTAYMPVGACCTAVDRESYDSNRTCHSLSVNPDGSETPSRL